MTRKATPKVIEIAEEEEHQEEEPTNQPTTIREKAELTPIQLGLK